MTNKQIDETVVSLIDRLDTLLNDMQAFKDEITAMEDKYSEASMALDQNIEELEIQRSYLAELSIYGEE